MKQIYIIFTMIFFLVSCGEESTKARVYSAEDIRSKRISDLYLGMETLDAAETLRADGWKRQTSEGTRYFDARERKNKIRWTRSYVEGGHEEWAREFDNKELGSKDWFGGGGEGCITNDRNFTWVKPGFEGYISTMRAKNDVGKTVIFYIEYRQCFDGFQDVDLWQERIIDRYGSPTRVSNSTGTRWLTYDTKADSRLVAETNLTVGIRPDYISLTLRDKEIERGATVMSRRLRQDKIEMRTRTQETEF